VTLRTVSPFVAALMLAMTFSSCTCSSSTPEVPPAAPRTATSHREGFGKLTLKERPAPDVPRGAVTPDDVEARPAPTLPAALAGELPQDFPSDVPVYEGAKVAHVQGMPHDGRNVIFMLDEGTDPAKVFDFYKDDMEHSGWKTEQETQGKFLSFKKGEMVTNVIIGHDPESGQPMMSVMYYGEKPLPFKEF
jgi:hypothetical protein